MVNVIEFAVGDQHCSYHVDDTHHRSTSVGHILVVERIVDGNAATLTVLALYESGGVRVRTLLSTEFLVITDVHIAAEASGDVVLVASTFMIALADKVWDELLAGHVTADTAGLVLNDWQDAGRLDTILDAIPTTAMRGTENAALASVVGALADGAAADEVTSADTLMQYIKQLINILVGTPGVVTLKPSADPASGVSLSEMVGAMFDILAASMPKSNTDYNNIPFFMVLSSDHVTAATGLVPVATKSLDGGTTWTSTTGDVAEAANGLYHFDANAVDMNATGKLSFKFAVATADDTVISMIVRP